MHWLLAISQAWPGAQSGLLRHCTHWKPSLQTGLAGVLAQSAFVVQSTHCLRAGSQAGVAGVAAQSALIKQATQADEAGSQRVPGQSASSRQPHTASVLVAPGRHACPEAVEEQSRSP
jgi:hypothetical protein